MNYDGLTEDVLEEFVERAAVGHVSAGRPTPLAPDVDPRDFDREALECARLFRVRAGERAQRRAPGPEKTVTPRERQDQKNAWARAARASGKKLGKPRDRREYERLRYLRRRAA